METWSSIPGFDGMYEASDAGNVRSLKHFAPKVLKAHTQHKKTYRVVCLGGRDGWRPFLVHRLILMAFVGLPEEGQEACHNNGDGADNRLENLRWGTHAENCADQAKHGTHRNTVKTGCKRGHPLSGDNLIIRIGGGRNCRTCKKIKERENRLKRLGRSDEI